MALEAVVQVLKEYNFNIRHDKIVKATKRLEFCGYLLTGTSCSPSLSRTRFTEEVKEKLLRNALLRLHPNA
jgi:hypothetical protein